MKNLIIAGVPRSGKTTLARRLCSERGFSLIPADALVSTCHRVFPEHGISHFREHHVDACDAFRPFLSELLRQLEYEAFPFVLDVYHVRPESLRDLQHAFGVLCLGYPSATPQEKMADIARYARPADWTADLAEDEIQTLVHRFIDESKVLERECAAAGIPFVDTATGFEAALQRALERLLATASEEL